jgi:hypothetical protein
MKAIGTIVTILIAAIAVAIYFTTREPNRELDAEGQAWVSDYETWSKKTQRQLDRALVGMEFESEAKNARLIEPLRQCFADLTGLGQAPGFLSDAEELSVETCGTAAHAVDVNDRFGSASLATVKLNLNEAEDSLLAARRVLTVELEKANA